MFALGVSVIHRKQRADYVLNATEGIFNMGPFFPYDWTVTAGRWTMFKARLFGRKYEDISGGYVLVAYWYKNKWYIDKYSKFGL